MRAKIDTETGFMYIDSASMSRVGKVTTTDRSFVGFGAGGESTGVDVQRAIDTIDLTCNSWHVGGQIRGRCAGGK